ncbi:MAG TPA: hypothetical protein VIL49_13970, partial [Capillimicrobium sp.]
MGMIGRGTAAAAALTAIAALAAGPAHAAPPDNDMRADARALTVPSKVNGTTRGATLQENDPFGGCEGVENSVWYSLDPSATQRVSIELRAEGDLEPVIDVFQRDRSQLEEIDCDTGDRRGRAAVNFTATADERYLIRVGQSFASEPGDFSLDLFSPEPEARPPGKLLPRKGGRASVDRTRDDTDAWSARLIAGVTYVVALGSRSDGCPSVSVFEPGIGSFGGGGQLGGADCNEHELFTPEESGRYPLLVRAGRNAPGSQRYRLRVRPAAIDDTAPGRTIANYQRVIGRIGPRPGDFADLIRIHITRRSDVTLRFSGAGVLQLRTVRGRLIDSSGGSLRTRLRRGRFYAVIRGTRDGSGGRYSLRPVIRQITRTHVSINGRHDSVIRP